MAEAGSPTPKQNPRPLSPHLQIYRNEINMVMSIIHRITGAALYFGTVLVAWWLASVASGPDYHAYVSDILSSWPARIVLVGYTWALFHHLFGGLRHFVWDTGRGYDLKMIDIMSWATLAVSLAATALIWLMVCYGNGGPAS